MDKTKEFAPPKEPAAAAGAADKKDPTKDPLRDLVLRLAVAAGEVGRSDKATARDIQSLARDIEKPGRSGEAVFRTHVAYALQDAERHVGPIDIAPALRAELQNLAKTYPGLRNEKLQELVASTETIDSSRLVREVRATAKTVAGRADQHDLHSESLTTALSYKVVVSMEGKDQGPAATTSSAPPAAPSVTTREVGTAPEGSYRAPAELQAVTYNQQANTPTQPGRAMHDIMMALRRSEPEAPAPWDRQLTPMGDRIAAYNSRMREGAQEQVFRSAEKAGQNAASAMKEFTDGPGAAMMTRIRDAGKLDPNGVAGVLAGMKEGGPYAGLRQDFNVALQQEKGFAAAYERAAGGVARFGTERVEVDKIAATRPDAAAIAGRFQKIDAEIGKAASELPGKTGGKSFTDELAEHAAEIVKKAVEVVQNVFNRFRRPEGPSTGPS